MSTKCEWSMWKSGNKRVIKNNQLYWKILIEILEVRLIISEIDENQGKD